MWDIMYALFCLNLKLGMTHSDLHLNNVTINPNTDILHEQKSHDLYAVLEYWFAIETKGPYAFLIDFSRGTIHPSKVEKFEYFRIVSE